jgi:F0F1-type ATP synthase epsilon subunit
MSLAKDFTFEIIRPTQSVNERVEWIEVDSLTGSFTVGRGHNPLIAVLRQGGTISYSRHASSTVTLDITSVGIFTVRNDKAVVVFDE